MKEAFSHEETLALIMRAQSGDMQARQQLVEENSPLVKMLVKKFMFGSHEYEDLFQIGCVGLVKAILHYDEGFNVRFSTYAVPMITGELKRHLRDDGAVKVSRSLKETALRARSVTEELRRKNGKEPDVEQIANAMEIRKEDLIMALESVRMPVSIYEPIYEDDSSPVLLVDMIAQKQDEMGIEDRIMLKDAISTLEPDERKLVIMRYFKNKTQSETGKMLGLSQVQVSRLEQKIMKKMRKICCEA